MKTFKNALTIDLEDWFHILDVASVPPMTKWHSMESRVERNTEILLSMLQRRHVCGTFFVLGWIAENYPALVAAIAKEGHEIASHGYGHRLIYNSSPEDFEADLQRSQETIHAACGIMPQGYRAPGFSLNGSCLWAIDILVRSGFVYDSSIFPAWRDHGGFYGYSREIVWQTGINGQGLWEFPISVFNVMGMKFAFSGGGYLRFWPLPVVKYAIQNLNEKGTAAVVYFHPRDLDDAQPRLPMPWKRRWKTYYNLGKGAQKLDQLIQVFEFTTMKNVLSEYLLTKTDNRTEQFREAAQSPVHSGRGGNVRA